MYSYVTSISFVCHLYVLVYHSCVTRMQLYIICIYLHVICMSLVCTHMSSVCHSYVLVYNGMSLVCHTYVTCMYSYVMVCHLYVICMSLVYIRISSVYRWCVLLCHLYVTRMYSYVIGMSLVCGFTMNPLKRFLTSPDKISILTWRLLVTSSQNFSCELNSSRSYSFRNFSYLSLRF